MIHEMLSFGRDGSLFRAYSCCFTAWSSVPDKRVRNDKQTYDEKLIIAASDRRWHKQMTTSTYLHRQAMTQRTSGLSRNCLSGIDLL